MQRVDFFTVAMTLALAPVWNAAAAAPSKSVTEAEVSIRTYNYAHITEAQLVNARATTNAIFKGAGISLQWIDCRVQEDRGAPCTEPLYPGRDLMLRLMDRPQAQVSPQQTLALGESMLDREQSGGVLMTIHVLPVRAIAEQASTDFATVLGRAIAHEIGHLLLGTSEHPRTGLMRARWLQDELRGLRPASWRFSRREAAQMRQGLAVRARAAN